MDDALAAWMKSVKIEMIKRDLDGSDLAAAVGKAREYVAAVINGKRIAPDTANAISDFLNIQNAPYENIRHELASRTKAVKIALVERDWNISDLAKAIGKSRKFTTDVIRGYMIYPETAKSISDTLGISEAPYSNW